MLVLIVLRAMAGVVKPALSARQHAMEPTDWSLYDTQDRVSGGFSGSHLLLMLMLLNRSQSFVLAIGHLL